MSFSYIQASQSQASVVGAGLNVIVQITTAFTLNKASSDWTVNGSGGLVYGGSSGRAYWISADFICQTTASGSGSNNRLYILKGANVYPVFTSPTFFLSNSTPTITSQQASSPIVVEPGDILYLGFSSTLTANTVQMAINISTR